MNEITPLCYFFALFGAALCILFYAVCHMVHRARKHRDMPKPDRDFDETERF